jgi:hypothetical protein
MNNGVWNWPEEWYKDFHVITQLIPPTLMRMQEDTLIWKSRNGKFWKFSVSQAYKDLQSDDVDVTWSKIVWYTQNIPKHSFILWLAIQNILITQDKLKQWGSYDLMVCPLCYKDMDSHKHLFFKCIYAKKIWTKILNKLQLECDQLEWDDIVRKFADIFQGKTIDNIVRALCLAASVYFI